MKIRVLNESDLNSFRSLLLQSLDESPKSFSDSPTEIQNLGEDYFLKRLLVEGSPPETFVLGVFDPELIGMLSFKRDQRIKARHKSFVGSMYVTPERRGKGVGSSLLSDLLQKAKNLNGLEQVHLWVMNSETSARNLYVNAGFESKGLVEKDLVVDGSYVESEYFVRYLCNNG